MATITRGTTREQRGRQASRPQKPAQKPGGPVSVGSFGELDAHLKRNTTEVGVQAEKKGPKKPIGQCVVCQEYVFDAFYGRHELGTVGTCKAVCEKKYSTLTIAERKDLRPVSA